MAPISKLVREYTSDDSFTKLVIPAEVKGFQVCLTFARDYDGVTSTEGKFIPYWDTEKVTPQVVKDFKAKNQGVKVLVSIGNNNKGSFPFKLGGGGGADSVKKWVDNASKSLEEIIKNYNLDGIDIHYVSLDSTTSSYSFVQCIGNLVKALKTGGANVTVVSLATNEAINDSLYVPVFKNPDITAWIDTVVVQSFFELKPDPAKALASFVEKVEAITEKYPSVPTILLGYSSVTEDWANVSPPLFFVALLFLLGKNKVKGASIKVLCDIKSSFPPNWIPEMLSLAAAP